MRIIKIALITGAALMVLLCCSNSVFSRENINHQGKKARPNVYHRLSANCSAATSQVDMDINNVRTTLLNGGDLWWDLNDARYEIPKVDPPGSAPSIHSLFAGAIWIGGIDAGGNLKIAAQTYRQTGNDFWPGPLDDNASVDDATCQAYDRHWVVNGNDISQLIAAYEAGNLTQAQIPQSLLEWPARGNPFARGAGNVPLTINKPLAPFHDNNNDGIYNPLDGDYPVINPDCGDIYADEMIFWVYNDKGNIHTETGGLEIGLQINALAFAFTTSDEVNNMTFYRYNILNKSTDILNDVYMGQWVDPDLGCFDNDYVGCDTSLSLGICYNGTATDPDCATRGYGVQVPILGVDFFEGPKDSAGVELGMSSFLYYNNDFTEIGNPENAVHFYNYLKGFWKDNTPFTFGGNGHLTGQPFPYMFPGDPGDPNQWSECNPGGGTPNPPADRRFLQTSGPFVLEPGAVNNITVGVVWVRQQSQSGCAADFDLLRSADVKAQRLFDNCFKLTDGPDAPTIQIRELDRELILTLVNEPPSNNINEQYSEPSGDALDARINDPTITDTLYKFQGYKIYQLANAQVTASELDDPTKAKLVAVVDKEDDVIDLVNYTFDTRFGAEIPKLMVEGENKGIRHSFQIKTDLFATEDNRLVNHKTYYFTAIAYASNNFKDFDPLHPTEGGQKTPYLQGRRNFKIYSGIPHKVEPERGGTVLNSAYGDGVKITRIEGSGNGGLNLELTEESVNNILASPDHFFGPVEYEEGMGPVDIKVYDPLLVKDRNFELAFIDTTITDGVLSPQARWILRDLNTGTVIYSDRDISELYEQLIPEYGLSITVKQVPLPGDFSRVAPFNHLDDQNGVIEATLEFDNPTEQWLTGIRDQGTQSRFNWIRAGQYENPDDDFYDDYRDFYASLNAMIWRDPDNNYGSLNDGTIAPYCLAALQAEPNATPPRFSFGPAFPWQCLTCNNPPQNTLTELQSVDLVLTPDKSKWTRCVVLELGEDPLLNEGGARKGHIRQHVSLDIDGNPIPSDTGRSWFPGYAINVETGERLNIMFGEDSWLVGENGRDMLWNPTDNILSPLNQTLFGGKHYIYIMKTRYDEGDSVQRVLLDNFNTTAQPVKDVYKSIMWVTMSLLAPGYKLNDPSEIPSEARIRLRVNRPYATMTIDGSNNGLPKYFFSTVGMGTDTMVHPVAVDALDEIRVVPNPYYAYSAYETSQLDNRVKITNLPENATVSIYTLDGTLIRRFDRAINEDTSPGAPTDRVNLDNSIDWDLKNSKNIPIASGMYIIHVEVPGVGEKTVKWFGALRPIDLDTF